QPSRAMADRILPVLQGGRVIAGETIACAEIAAGELRIGVEVERAIESAARLLVTTGKQLEDRQRRVRHCVAVIAGDCLARRFTELLMPLDWSVAPAEHRLELPSKGA